MFSHIPLLVCFSEGSQKVYICSSNYKEQWLKKKKKSPLKCFVGKFKLFSGDTQWVSTVVLPHHEEHWSPKILLQLTTKNKTKKYPCLWNHRSLCNCTLYIFSITLMPLEESLKALKRLKLLRNLNSILLLFTEGPQVIAEPAPGPFGGKVRSWLWHYAIWESVSNLMVLSSSLLHKATGIPSLISI